MRSERERRIWWHAQNLNERERGPDGSILRHGRAWLHWGEACWQVGWDWFTPFRRAGITLDTGGSESDYSLHVGLFFGGFYFKVQGLRDFGAMQRNWERTTGISLYHDRLTLEWNCDDSSWSSTTGPAHGWQKSWALLDLLLGITRYTKGAAHHSTTVLSMPEGDYPCTVEMRTDSWSRPRWPFTKRITRATVEVEQGVPVPGKGENSWDCGDDAIYSLTAPAKNVRGALRAFQESAMQSRHRYGSGYAYKPSAGWTVRPRSHSQETPE